MEKTQNEEESKQRKKFDFFTSIMEISAFTFRQNELTPSPPLSLLPGHS